MKLMVESTDSVEYLIEASESGKKSYYIKGPFMQAEIANRNGRMYPRSVLEGQVELQQNLIREKRALGELNHPNGPTVSLDRVSHLITELHWSGNDVHGKAKVLDTPMGKIAKNFLDEGIKIGVSTRGMGSVKRNGSVNEVQKDFRLVCVDIVSDPSGPNCFVDGMMEGASWIFDEATNSWIEQKAEEIIQKIEESVRTKTLDTKQKFKLFEQWINTLSQHSKNHK